ncbi:family 43 glycosylhydrolase [Chitinophaga sp. SYP-B3965]|uniref:family 43 glycosylhydrolase n=1 Tax=Chitinophaga sp. SYP-B3965 TaxID=2663120 RepID=UPI001299FA4F|nr:family 43 glycosylhydrolase [Chitinophaga sp. SYP-B3965]MRG44199.1 family 43 glycosylhydrolase [Chitinophaga sp. SYP-B3965]
MKQMFVPFSLLFFLLSSCTKNVSPETANVTEEKMNVSTMALNTLSFIDNNSVWKDVAGDTIKAQGGFIIKEGSVYHWFGPKFGTGSDFHFYGVNHYTSEDLQNWTKLSPAIAPGMSGVPMNSGSWVGRPWVIKNPNNNNYVLGVEWGNGSGGVRNQYAFFTSSSINGPWAYQSTKLIQKMPDINNTLYALGDMGVYTEGNDAWLMYTFDKPQPNYAQAIVKLDTDFMTPLPHSVAGSYTEFSGGTWMAGVQEAAAIFKRGSTYYYFTSLCNGWPSSVSRYRTASSMSGPWSNNAIVPTNPSSTNSFNTQHDFILPITGTAGTTYMFCGDRWSNFTGSGIGFYGWYPLTFDASGVPTINAPGNGDWVLDLAAGTWSTPSTNLLLNPGFESDFSNWTTAGNASVATDPLEIHSGVRAAKTWSASAYTTSMQNASATNLAAGSYTTSVWSRGSGTFSQRVLQVYVNNVMIREKTLPVGTTWRLDTIRNVAASAGANIKVGVSFNASASAWTQVDDFELIKQ